MANLAAILVQVDIDEVAEGCVSVAVELASRFGSRLIGTCACAVQIIPGDAVAAGVPSFIQEPADISRQLETVRQKFTVLTQAIADSVEWRSAIGQPAGFTAMNARAADLVVVGPSLVESSYRSVRPADLVMLAGRPVLVVPRNGAHLDAQRIVVAWKDTREARHAVLDALPLLERATEVTVVAAIEDDDPQGGQSAADVASYLSRHGVTASGITVNAKSNASDRIAAFAREHGADLIVLGAYGHNRLREWVFGGVTRDLLDHSPVCCLMSH